MADPSKQNITDAQLAEELEKYGEKVQLPIKSNKRHILIKKLNHLKVRARAHEPTQSKSKQRSNSAENRPASTFAESSQNTKTPSYSQHNTVSSLRTRSQAGRSDLEAFSSDDSVSDTEPMSSYDYSNTNTNVDLGSGNSFSSVISSKSNTSNTNTRSGPINDKKRSPQLSDSILRTLRRRSGEAIPQSRNKSSEVFELSTERDLPSRSRSFDIIEEDGLDSIELNRDEESPVPSPARSRLYPDLRKLRGSYSTRSTIAHDKFDFESSDSDPESSTYEVENKSANTSFPSIPHGRQPANSFLSSSYNTSFQDSPLARSRLPSRRRNSGIRRVQQYKSAITDHLPHCLIAVAMCFFIGLSVVYIANHKDFFLSWLTTSSNMGSNNNILICQDDHLSEGCYPGEEIEKAMKYVAELFDELSVKKGNVLCEELSPGEHIAKVSSLKDKIYMDFSERTTVESLYVCCVDHILQNPLWNLRLLRVDGTEAKTVAEVAMFESKVAFMSFWCRLRRSFSTVLYGLFLFTTLIAGVMFISVYIKYRLKQQEKEQTEVFNMAEKIIDILQAHHERTRGEDSDEPQYLAVQHVRDQLLPPSIRRKQQPIWDKSVDFISANESRVRLETRLIHGDEFDVWHWLQPSSHNGKIWQGQAFGEASDNNSNQRMYSPTPCLKIRNMFDSNVESEDDWESGVVDAILEKCRGIEHVVHAYVDVDSQEGCVYIKCSSLEAAGRARLALHGWWFAGRLITVKHLKTDHYHKRWPDARTATAALRPSTNQMKSLSQPFHRSSLEMT